MSTEQETKNATEVYWSPFIGDGYDETATIPANPGLWSAVKINYRIISADENSEVLVKTRLYPNMSRVYLYAELFARKLIGWDLKDRKGNPVPITPDNISRLSVDFYDMLHEYLAGTMPSDNARSQMEADLKNLSKGSD